jgi:hypothetical protein
MQQTNLERVNNERIFTSDSKAVCSGGTQPNPAALRRRRATPRASAHARTHARLLERSRRTLH